MNNANAEMIISQWKGSASKASNHMSFAHPAGPNLLDDAALDLVSGGAKSVTLKLTGGASSSKGWHAGASLTIRW